MIRLVSILSVICCGGCSSSNGPDPSATGRESPIEVEDGGSIGNADRVKAEAYFTAMGNIESVEAEEKLFTEFGNWLKEKGYSIRVEERNGNHYLSCPYFPPVTPWAEYSFRDIKHLQRLPQVKDDE